MNVRVTVEISGQDVIGYVREPQIALTTSTGSNRALGNLLMTMASQGTLRLRRPDDPGQLCRQR